MDKFKNKKNSIIFGAATAFLTFAVLMVVYYIVSPSAAYFHADCTDTILWAQASLDSKSIFNPDFAYAATLPFGGTMIMIPFVAIFGVGMTAHHIGMVIFTLLMLASFLLLCRSIEMSVSSSFFTVGALAFTLCASEKLREIFYEHVIYYSICVAMISVLLSLLIRFEKAYRAGNKKKAVIFACVAAVFTVCSALDGIQVLALGIFPVLFALAVDIFFGKEKILSKENCATELGIAVTVVAMAVGMLIFSVLSNGISVGYSNAYVSYSDMEEWVTNLEKFPVAWFGLFGINAEYGMSIFGFDSIINIIKLAVSVMILLVPIVGLIFIRKLEKPQRYAVLAHFGVSAVIMFGFIFGILSTANWRLSPMICTGLLASAATFTGLRKNIVSVRFEALTACLLVLLSVVSTVTIAQMPRNGIEYNPKYAIIKELESRGLDYGYATFWNSQVITVLSDSRVHAANVDVNSDGVTPCKYQANIKWFETQEGVDKYFLLLSDSEVETLRETNDWFLCDALVSERIYLDGWTVFVFDNTDFLK